MIRPGAAAFRRQRGRMPLIIGHRGVRGAAPENTLASFQRAADEGADGIELDVRVDRDGVPVVLHDPDFARVSGGKDDRRAVALCYDEIRRIDVGDGERAPLLTEALALARARRLRVNVEIKHDVPDRIAVVRAVARQLSAFDPAVPVIVSSFNPFVVASFGALAPRIPTALLVPRRRWSPVALRLPRALFASALHPERTIASPVAIARLREGGLLVNVWTVNDPHEARDLAALGVDGLITDVPAATRAALAELFPDQGASQST